MYPPSEAELVQHGICAVLEKHQPPAYIWGRRWCNSTVGARSQTIHVCPQSMRAFLHIRALFAYTILARACWSVPILAISIHNFGSHL